MRHTCCLKTQSHLNAFYLHGIRYFCKPQGSLASRLCSAEDETRGLNFARVLAHCAWGKASLTLPDA